MQFDTIGEPAVGVEHHGPGQLGDLAGAEPGSDRQQDHHSVPLRVSPTARVAQRCNDLLAGEDLGLFACHGAGSVFLG